MKRIFQSILVAGATLAVLILVWELRSALILFVLSLAVASATRGPVDFWTKRRLPRSLAILLTYFLILSGLGLLLYLVSGRVLHDLQQATDLFDRTYRLVTLTWPSGTAFQQMVAAQLPAPQDLYNAIAGEQGAQLLQKTVGVASGFMGGLAKFAIVLVLSIYWSFDRLHFENLWLSLLPVDKRSRARDIWREMEDRVGGYIRSEVVQSVIAGLALGLGYSVMGLQFPALIALIGALLWLIPWMGAALALILPLVAGLYTAPALAVIAPLYTAVVLVVLELVVEPRLVDRRRYSSLLTVIILVAMTQAYGLMGMLFAPPLAAAIQTLYNSLVLSSAPVIEEDLANKLDSLRQRAASLAARLGIDASQPTPEAASLLGRITSLVEEADQYLEGDARRVPHKVPPGN